MFQTRTRFIGLTLATRHIADFQATGISLVSPWEHGA